MNDCILFNGVKNKAGYGVVMIYRNGKRTSTSAHRYYYELHHNIELTKQQFICHACDNPECINISHLWLGDAKSNNHDKIIKGRTNYNPECTRKKRTNKLTDSQVIEIYRSEDKYIVLSKKYNISMAQISRIKRGTRKQLTLKELL